MTFEFDSARDRGFDIPVVLRRQKPARYPEQTLFTAKTSHAPRESCECRERSRQSFLFKRERSFISGWHSSG